MKRSPRYEAAEQSHHRRRTNEQTAGLRDVICPTPPAPTAGVAATVAATVAVNIPPAPAPAPAPAPIVIAVPNLPVAGTVVPPVVIPLVPAVPGCSRLFPVLPVFLHQR